MTELLIQNTSGFGPSEGMWTSINLGEDSGLRINYNSKDILDPTSIATNASTQFTIVGTKEVNDLFTYIFDVNFVSSATTFDINSKVNCVIVTDTIPQMTGYLQLMQITIDEFNRITYQVIVFDNKSNIITGLGDKLFVDNYDSTQDLDVSSTVNTWSYQDVYNKCYNQDINADKYCYPLIHRGLAEHFAHGTTTTAQFGLDRTDIMETMYPALYVKPIFDAIVTEAGFTYSSSFLNTDHFKSLILPYNGNIDECYTKHSQVSLLETNCMDNFTMVVSPSILIGNYIQFDNNVLNVGGYFTKDTIPWPEVAFNNFFYAPTTGYYRVTVQTIITPPSNCAFNFRLVKSHPNFDTTYEPVGTQICFDNVDVYTTGTSVLVIKDVLFNQGDIVRLGFLTGAYGTFAFTHPSLGFESIKYTIDFLATGSMNFNNSPAVLPGVSTFTVNDILPKEVKQKDFFVDICKMFNLIIAPDATNPSQLTIEPYATYYDATEKTSDWTKKIVRDSIQFNFLQEKAYKTLNFDYLEGEDWVSGYISEIRGRPYGGLTVTNNNEYSTEEYNVELTTLASTWLNTEYNNTFTSTITSQAGFGTGSNAQYLIPWLWKEDATGISTATNLRILYFNPYIMPGGANFAIRQDDNSVTRYNAYPYAGPLYNPLDSGSLDLTFENLGDNTVQQYIEHVVSSSFTPNNLFKTYWEPYFADLNNKDLKVLSAEAYLTPSDIASFKYNDKIIVDNAYYRINNISNYNPAMNGLCDIELIQILPKDLSYVPRNESDVPIDLASLPQAYGNDTLSYMTLNLGDNGLVDNTDLIVAGNNNTCDNTDNGLIIGDGNVVSSGSNNLFILGNNNSINSGSNITIINGNGQVFTTGSNYTYIGGNTIYLDSNDITTPSGSLINETEFNLFTASLATGSNITALDNQILFMSGSVVSGSDYFHYNKPLKSFEQGEVVVASAQFSHAQGSVSLASGPWSHAEGRGTTASGNGAHSEGNSTTAQGAYAHAEGLSSRAVSNYSHAEGQTVSASGLYSHAEGQSTKTTGGHSHAEGSTTLASGNASHAEGVSTLASNSVSHAEGNLATASGQYSHAEGYLTAARGTGSHAEGSGSIAQSDFSFIHSNNSIVTGLGSAVIGGSNITGSADNTVYVPYLNISGTLQDDALTTVLVRATDGTVKYRAASTLGTAVDTGSFVTTSSFNSYTSSVNTSITNLNIHSASVNSHTGSYALTSSFKASNQHVVYMKGTIYTGSDSFTYDYPNEALSQGLNTYGSGSYSHAQGRESHAYGIYSHAEGQWCVSTGIGGHSEGYYATASGQYAHAEGYYTIADGGGSHAEGDYCTANGGAAHAEGYHTLAKEVNSHAEGVFATASANGSHAEGHYTIASGQSSHAEGLNTSAKGTGSHAEGYLTTASADWSHAQGYLTEANGTGSCFSSGVRTNAKGNHTFIHSTDSSVTGERSVVLGGTKITGSAPDTVYVPYLNIGSTLANDALTNVLVIDATGSVKVRTAASLGGTGSFDTGSFVTTSSFNNYTASVNTSISNLNTFSSSINLITGSFATTSSLNTLSSSFNSYTQSNNNQITNLNNFTSSANTSISNLNIHSASLNAFTASINLITGSYATTSSLNTLTSSFNNYTSSVNTSISNLNINSASFNNFTASFTGSNINATHEQILFMSGSNVSGSANFHYNDSLKSFEQGTGCIASGINSHAEGSYSKAYGENSHTEGSSQATGVSSHAEGVGTLASGSGAHSEGGGTIAEGQNAHAEGGVTYASGEYSHAEGFITTASGYCAHSEGFGTTANGEYSHAQGYQTIANGTGSSFASGVRTNAKGNHTFIHSTDSSVTGDRSVVLGGSKITGSMPDTVYVPYLNIGNTLSNDALTNILVIDATGSIKTKTVNSITDNITASFNAYTASVSTAIDNLNIHSSSLNIFTSSINTFTQSINTATGSFVTTSSFNNYTSSVDHFTSSLTRLIPAYNTSFAKATTQINASYAAWLPCNPALSVIGAISGNSWGSSFGNVTNQRYHFDLGNAVNISQIYYENGHQSGVQTDQGIKNFTLQGSNTAASFATVTFASESGWTDIGNLSQTYFDSHSAVNAADPKYINIAGNSGSFRYYALKIVDNWGDPDYIVARRIMFNSFDTGSTKLNSDSNNCTYIESDGTLVMTGSATVYNDIICPIGNMRSGNTPPSYAIAFTGSIYTTTFKNGNDMEVYGCAELPHDYKEGTALNVHVHWSPDTTNTGHCGWKFEYTYANADFAFPASQTLTAPAGVTGSGVVNSHINSLIGTITDSTLRIGSVIAYRLWRSGSDAYSGDAFGHQLGIHYESDTLGSRTTLIK